jgi:hypothetical protein
MPLLDLFTEDPSGDGTREEEAPQEVEATLGGGYRPSEGHQQLFTTKATSF